MDHSRYIDVLYSGQNIGAADCQRNLVPRAYYENLVLSVDKVLRDNPDASLSELRNILIQNSKIEEKLGDFCLARKKASGMLVSVRTNNYYHDFCVGSKQEVENINGEMVYNPEDMSSDAIFDLASITKLFTSLATLKLVELDLIDLNDYVIKYIPQFTNLTGIKIFDLLTYKAFETGDRIDNATSIGEAESILFKAYPKRLAYGQSSYNDFGAMILKYLIEAVTHMSYYDFLKKYILDPLNMNNTLVTIDKDKIDRVVSTNGDVRIYSDDKIIERNYITKGISSDDKARILGQPMGLLSGHAGLFSSASDIEKLTKGLVSSSFISYDLRNAMAKNVAGYLYSKPDGSTWATQFLGMLVYSKNPIDAITEVYQSLSGNSFSSSGWTGTYYTLDPLNGISVFFGSNRTHNRVSINSDISKDIIGPHGEKYVQLPDGRKIIDASRFVYEREFVVCPAIELALRLKILEDMIAIRNVPYEEGHTRVLK